LAFSITENNKISLTEFENLIIWERDVYIAMLNNKIQDENDRIEELKMKGQY
tara:strand:- start:2032 stop:2187 length:156 start_codon:yes stop_codon:yes gene_type:complete